MNQPSDLVKRVERLEQAAKQDARVIQNMKDQIIALQQQLMSAQGGQYN
jgi:hypothetical protein